MFGLFLLLCNSGLLFLLPLFFSEPFVVIILLICKDLHELSGEFTDLLTKLVVAIECVLGSELPMAIFLELGDVVLILVFVVVVELGGKDCESANLQAVEELLKNNFIKIVVINQ